MTGFLDVMNWRDAASAACDCWAGVLGDQGVNAVSQNPGLTARNQAHGELTASNQSLAHTRGDSQAPRDPGLRNPLASSLELREPLKKNCPLLLAYEIFGWLVPKAKWRSLIPCVGG